MFLNIAENAKTNCPVSKALGKVEIKMWTHKIDGLTESDFIFAAKVDDVL